MHEIKLRLDRNDLDRLTAEAAAAGITRAALIRDRALVTNPCAGVAKLTTVAYHALVADAVAFMRADLSRSHVETLVAYVIRRLDQHSRQTISSHQSPQ